VRKRAEVNVNAPTDGARIVGNETIRALNVSTWKYAHISRRIAISAQHTI